MNLLYRKLTSLLIELLLIFPLYCFCTMRTGKRIFKSFTYLKFFWIFVEFARNRTQPRDFRRGFGIDTIISSLYLIPKQ